MLHRFSLEKSRFYVESLSAQCRSFILMHLEELPVSYLSLLPLFDRKWLLQRLPIADICLLEDTDFMNGIDMEKFWKLPSAELAVPVEESEYFVSQWGRAKFAKAILYGEVAATIIHCLPYGFVFSFVHGRKYVRFEDLIKFLYAVREFTEDECCFTFPSRYHTEAILNDRGSHRVPPEEIIDVTVKCFRGELPKILNRVYVHDGTRLKYDFLRDLRLLYILGIEWEYSRLRGFEFVRGVLEKATHLEVLLFEGDDYSSCSDSVRNHWCLPLDNFFSYLSSHPTFLSEFRVLKLLSYFPGYCVSMEHINGLIPAYLSTPTEHAQTVRFTGLRVNTFEMSPVSNVNHQYLQLKNIELHNFWKYCRDPGVDSRSISDLMLAQWLALRIHMTRKKCNICSYPINVISFSTQQ